MTADAAYALITNGPISIHNQNMSMLLDTLT